MKIYIQNKNLNNAAYKEFLNDSFNKRQYKKLWKTCVIYLLHKKKYLPPWNNYIMAITTLMASHLTFIFFLLDINSLLMDSIDYALATRELPIEQKGESPPFFPQKDKSHHLLKNWRLISLCNTDYEIVAKLITNCLNIILPLLINKE